MVVCCSVHWFYNKVPLPECHNVENIWKERLIFKGQLLMEEAWHHGGSHLLVLQ